MMAGLLDIFGSSGTDSLGLLGMSADDIKRARDDAQAQAMYALAGRLFQGGNTGQSIAQGLQMGQQAYKQAMNEQLGDKLQKIKLQELIRQQQEAQQAQKDKALARQIFAKGFQPEQTTTEYGHLTPQQLERANEPGFVVPQTTTTTPAHYDYKRIIPLIQSGVAGDAGYAELKKQLDLQKMLQGETIKLGAEETLFSRDPFSNQLTQVGTGAPKVQKLGDKEGNAALMLYGTSDIDKIRSIPGAVDAIRKEATNQRLAEKPQINLKDPTAVQSQQLKTINQWEGLLNQNKTQEVADRASAFYGAYNLAKGGNRSADGAIIYHVAKSYDPGGVVQAGDISTVIGVRGMPDVIASAAQKVAKGGTLLPKERENLKVIMDDLVEKKKKSIQPSLETYRGINRSLGGNDSAIVNPFDYVEKPKSLDEILGGGR
jgi:hypothetical protein